MVEIGRSYFVYLLASRINGTLYVGVTSELLNRTIQHRERGCGSIGTHLGSDCLSRPPGVTPRESGPRGSLGTSVWTGSWVVAA